MLLGQLPWKKNLTMVNNFIALTESVEIGCQKPDNPAMSPHAFDKTGTRHTDTQWKTKGGEGKEQKPLNTPRIMLLIPATLIKKRYSPEHKEFPACASILNPLTK